MRVNASAQDFPRCRPRRSSCLVPDRQNRRLWDPQATTSSSFSSPGSSSYVVVSYRTRIYTDVTDLHGRSSPRQSVESVKIRVPYDAGGRLTSWGRVKPGAAPDPELRAHEHSFCGG